MSGKRNWGDNMSDRMDGKVPPPMYELVQKTPSKLWRLKYECKKNKGDHTFEVEIIKAGYGWRQLEDGTWERLVHGWRAGRDYGWVDWRCTGCGKKALEWTPPEKKFDKYRHTIWTR